MGPLLNPSRHQRAFTLIEILIVLVIVGILIAMALALTRGISAGQKRSVTVNRLAAADAALVQFVMQSRRLPCPADGTVASGGANAGVEMRDAATQLCTLPNQTNGVLPWITLGLPEADATDGWDRRFTFRVSPALAADKGMDMSMCDPAGTEAPAEPPGLTTARNCSLGCSTVLPSTVASCTPPLAFLIGKGLSVRSPDDTPVTVMDPNAVPNTGAAYVLISAGESGGGAYLSTGQVASSTGGEGTAEMKNYAAVPYVSSAVTHYIDGPISDVQDTHHFDDIVSRPPILGVITRAALGPRTH
jgi:prepilin-type N-terminal cleavage/methylation domain-containing protein